MEHESILLGDMYQRRMGNIPSLQMNIRGIINIIQEPHNLNKQSHTLLNATLSLLSVAGRPTRIDGIRRFNI